MATNDSRAALATHALGFVKAGDVVGLGSGRAAEAFVHALASRVRDGLRIRGVPTSEATERLARELGIDLVGLEAEIALTVDGADEVDGPLDLIKGHGRGPRRERIAAAGAGPGGGCGVGRRAGGGQGEALRVAGREPVDGDR